MAERAETLKQTKYAELAASGDFEFAPIAIETLGAWGPAALSICGEIGGRIAAQTGDMRSFAFLGKGWTLQCRRAMQPLS